MLRAMTTTSRSVMRVGVAGLGAGADNALRTNPGLARHPHVQLAGAADVRPQARNAFTARFGVPAFSSVEEMCERADVDCVYILTPNALHARHAIVAAEYGKQVIADKPMALSLAECDAMIEAAARNGVRLLIGHSQSLDSGILKMAEIVQSGALGAPIMIASQFYNEWIYRPRSRDELDPSTLEGSLTLRQGWVQLDIIRMLGGGLLRSLRGATFVADPQRPIDGAYTAFLQFENGAAATALFDAYGHFDVAELTFGVGFYGRDREKNTNLDAHRLVASFASREEEYAYKNEGRVGGSRARTTVQDPTTRHQFFGLTIVSCERGAVRQTPTGVTIYGADAWREVAFPARFYTEIELDLMYAAWSNDWPLQTHDGGWGKATTEACLALLESSRTRREIRLEHQVAFSLPELQPS